MTAPTNLSKFINYSRHSVHFSITADADPGALPRVLELFALRGLTPDLVKVSKFKQQNFLKSNLAIDVHISGLSPAEQDIILQKLHTQVSVQNVREEVLLGKLAS